MGIDFGAGTLYFLGNEGEYIQFGDVTEVNFEEAETTDISEVVQFTLLSQAEASFEGLCRISKVAYMALTGLRDEVLSLCLNKKVVHLAKHAAKRKIRNKNFNRAIRILEKEKENG